MEFDWDPHKATSNLRRHKVSFSEAATVFSDPLSTTVPDPDHSLEEDRAITVGLSHRGRLLWWPIPSVATVSVSSVHENSHGQKEHSMKKDSDQEMDDDLRPEYDLTQLLKDGVRGKYAERYRAGTNLVLLAPDVAHAFPTEEAVNQALRLVLQLAKIPTGATTSPSEQ
jgi:uncharacterized DUF497 family protein